MNRTPLPEAFAAWLECTGMTGAEKKECLRLARQGFSQKADLLLLGEPGTEERLLLRALGVQRNRSDMPQQLGSWRVLPCPAGRSQRESLARFLEVCGTSGRKKLVILFAASGRGGRLRAQRVWRRACAGLKLPLDGVPVLTVQILRANRPGRYRFCRQENSEWRLQQAATDCLGRQVPVLTVASGCGREQLWYQLAKNLV